MTDQWTPRLSEYLDDELSAAERLELEAHLGSCPACRETLAELEAVVARARSLEDRQPGRDLWPGVAERIGAAAPGAEPVASRWRRLRLTLSVPQLAAAAVALMALSAGSVWLTRPRPRPTMQEAAAPPAAGSGVGVSPVVMEGEGYDAAVRDLERVLEEGRGRLDTATVRVLEQNLRIIDEAITQSRRALAADPASPYLNAHLAQTLKRKLELLRQAARLTTART